MSMRRTHLEVQVLVGKSKRALKKWQHAWKTQIFRMRLGMNQDKSGKVDNKEKEKDSPDLELKSDRQCDKSKKSGEPNMENELDNPLEPELVLLDDFDVDQALAARLTSSSSDTETYIQYGCTEWKPCMQPDRFESRKPHTWLFQLSDKPRWDNRRFHLHLHKATPATRFYDKTWGDEICKAFTFQDLQGSCCLRQLGFTQDNQPVQREFLFNGA